MKQRKRPIFRLLTLILSLLVLSSSMAMAAERDVLSSTEQVVWINSNTYYTITESNNKNARGALTAFEKTINYYKSDVKKCSLTFTAYFDVNYGSNVACIDSTTQVWKAAGWDIRNITTSGRTGYGSSATATVNFQVYERILGIYWAGEKISNSISCDKYGN